MRDIQLEFMCPGCGLEGLTPEAPRFPKLFEALSDDVDYSEEWTEEDMREVHCTRSVAPLGVSERRWTMLQPSEVLCA